MDFVTTVLNQYIADPKFIQVCAFTFLTLDALQEIKAVDAWASQWKKVASLAIGSAWGLAIIQPSLMGFLVGFLAGGATTLTLDRLQILFKSKTPTV